MHAIIHDTVGLIHFLSALLALVTGAFVLYLPKGSSTHRRIGYVYAVTMIVMLITAFLIYALFGTFGPFHWLAVVSTLTLIGGMVPVLLRRPAANYLLYHFSFMYWSVVGLYLALFGELAAHLPELMSVERDRSLPLLIGIGVAAAVFAVSAQLFWNRKKHEWSARYRRPVAS
ncbi:putative membrane protein DUF2306 [Neolewinella xylanilytica]|uniref:Putative membrane protein DUF2306 n=1 Tax=Neolewinella xylanilytica TaxID=1514080 RepID=A0A2S6I802_9BACT|nr:DUF2306 domain-containing protein [Neolewinella xylanilytica]PPK87627.1 putative membrane protein DUF2306 [Neolewinella xylanilytica]